MGGVLRILQLCSDENDADGHIRNLYQRLISRGHQPTNLLPLFDKAITNAHAYLAKHSTSTKKKPVPAKKRDSIYFHIPFHPQDPPAKHWQDSGKSIWFSLPTRSPSILSIVVRRLLSPLTRWQFVTAVIRTSGTISLIERLINLMGGKYHPSFQDNDIRTPVIFLRERELLTQLCSLSKENNLTPTAIH